MTNQSAEIKGGAHWEDAAQDLAALDALPRLLRQEIMHYAHSVSATMVLGHFRSLPYDERDPEYYLTAYMRPILSQQMAANSYTGIEKYGAYKIVRNIHAKPSHAGRIRSLRGGGSRRHGGVFPPIPTRRGTEIDYR